MKADELRSRTMDELEQELLNLRKEHFSLRMQRATGELSHHTEYGRVKKDIARVKTVMVELRAKSEEA